MVWPRREFVLQKSKAVWSVKISGNSSSLSSIGVWSPKCGRFSRFSLWFTDSQPNNGAFFQYLPVRNTLSVEKGTFLFVFKKKKTWVIWVSPPPNRSRNLVPFFNVSANKWKSKFGTFFRNIFLLSVGSTVASHPQWRHRRTEMSFLNPLPMYFAKIPSREWLTMWTELF